MAEPTVLVLGCGIGGVMAAREAKRLLHDARVVVIDRETQASFPPSYLWVVTGERRPEAIRRRRTQLSRHGIEFVNAEVRQIDPVNRYVRADSREFHYDHLVIALGAEASLDSMPELSEAALGFYTLEQAERLAAALRYFAGGRVLIAVAGEPFKAPSAPYEAAMLLEDHFHTRRIRQKVEIDLYTPEERPLAFAGPDVGEEVCGLLAHKGIGYHPEMRIVAADPHRHEASFADGSVAPFTLLVCVPQHHAPAVIREAGLIDETGWLPVDPETMETAQAGVFAIGDVNSVRLPDGTLLPKTGVFAEAQARVAARQIAHRERGGRPPRPFSAEGHIYLETDAGAAALAEGDFLAPQRRIVLKQPSIAWHLAKATAERYWLWRRY